MRKCFSLGVFRYDRNCSSLIKFVIYLKIKFANGQCVIILVKSQLLILYFLHVHWFYFLGSKNRQQTNDEENPERRQLLSHIDKGNGRDGLYIFERNVQDKNNSLKLESNFSLFLLNKIFNLIRLICKRVFDNQKHSETRAREESLSDTLRLMPLKPYKNNLSKLFSGMLLCSYLYMN